MHHDTTCPDGRIARSPFTETTGYNLRLFEGFTDRHIAVYLSDPLEAARCVERAASAAADRETHHALAALALLLRTTVTMQNESEATQ